MGFAAIGVFLPALPASVAASSQFSVALATPAGPTSGLAGTGTRGEMGGEIPGRRKAGESATENRSVRYAVLAALELTAWEADGQDTAEAVRAFYASRGYALFWLEGHGMRERARRLLDILAKAEEHGLPLSRYEPKALFASIVALEQAWQPVAVAFFSDGVPFFPSPNPVQGNRIEAAARLEVALMRAYLRYGRDLSGGFLDPQSLSGLIHTQRQPVSAGALIALLELDRNFRQSLADIAPKGRDYAALKRELAKVRALAHAEKPLHHTFFGKALARGAHGARVRMLRERLERLGFLDRSAEEEKTAMQRGALPAGGRKGDDPALFDDRLDEALRRFQAHYGLRADGIAGVNTQRLLARGVHEWALEIAANMERIRWLNRDLGARHVMVNIAAQTVRLMEKDKTRFQSRVIVGRADRGRQTPEFSDEMTYLVFNPYWHVPRSIAVGEILPRLRANPAWLEKNNMVLTDAQGAIAANGAKDAAAAASIDWARYGRNNFPFRVRQLAGEGNALGVVKFMMPNRFSVYLHDTPHRTLFRKARRAFSHGCVRVENPLALAKALLAPQTETPSLLIERLLRHGEDHAVHLAEPLPVHITYRTVWLDETGALRQEADIYGRNGTLRDRLAESGLMARGG